MNPLMIQQALLTARALPAAAGSAGTVADIGSFAAAIQGLMGDGEPQAPGKTGASALADPLAALLLAAALAQAQPAVADAAGNDAQPAAAQDSVVALGNAMQVGPATAEQANEGERTVALTPDAPALVESLSLLLQEMGLSQSEATGFAQQLTGLLQTAQSAVQPTQQLMAQTTTVPSAVQTTVQPAIQTTAQTVIPYAARPDVTTAAIRTFDVPALQTERGEAPEAPEATAPEALNRIRALLDALLGETSTQETQPPAAPAPQLDTATALELRQLLVNLEQNAAPRRMQNAPAAAPAQAAPVAVVQPTATSSAGDEPFAAQDDADTDAGSTAITTVGATAQFVPLQRGDAVVAGNNASDAQAPRRTLGEAFDTMVDTISSMRDSNRSEMEIHLKPDFLGKVVIHLTMEQGSLVARIAASSQSVQDAFQAQAPQLTAALQQQGIRDVTVLVTHDTASGSALNQSAARQQQNPREQRRRSYAIPDVAEKTDAARVTAAYEQFLHNGTINYLA